MSEIEKREKRERRVFENNQDYSIGKESLIANQAFESDSGLSAKNSSVERDIASHADMISNFSDASLKSIKNDFFHDYILPDARNVMHSEEEIRSLGAAQLLNTKLRVDNHHISAASAELSNFDDNSRDFSVQSNSAFAQDFMATNSNFVKRTEAAHSSETPMMESKRRLKKTEEVLVKEHAEEHEVVLVPPALPIDNNEVTSVPPALPIDNNEVIPVPPASPIDNSEVIPVPPALPIDNSEVIPVPPPLPGGNTGGIPLPPPLPGGNTGGIPLPPPLPGGNTGGIPLPPPLPIDNNEVIPVPPASPIDNNEVVPVPPASPIDNSEVIPIPPALPIDNSEVTSVPPTSPIDNSEVIPVPPALPIDNSEVIPVPPPLPGGNTGGIPVPPPLPGGNTGGIPLPPPLPGGNTGGIPVPPPLPGGNTGGIPLPPPLPGGNTGGIPLPPPIGGIGSGSSSGTSSGAKAYVGSVEATLIAMISDFINDGKKVEFTTSQLRFLNEDISLGLLKTSDGLYTKGTVRRKLTDKEIEAAVLFAKHGDKIDKAKYDVVFRYLKAEDLVKIVSEYFDAIRIPKNNGVDFSSVMNSLKSFSKSTLKKTSTRKLKDKSEIKLTYQTVKEKLQDVIDGKKTFKELGKFLHDGISTIFKSQWLFSSNTLKINTKDFSGKTELLKPEDENLRKLELFFKIVDKKSDADAVKLFNDLFNSAEFMSHKIAGCSADQVREIKEEYVDHIRKASASAASVNPASKGDDSVLKATASKFAYTLKGVGEALKKALDLIISSDQDEKESYSDELDFLPEGSKSEEDEDEDGDDNAWEDDFIELYDAFKKLSKGQKLNNIEKTNVELSLKIIKSEEKGFDKDERKLKNALIKIFNDEEVKIENLNSLYKDLLAADMASTSSLIGEHQGDMGFDCDWVVE
jgi:hypothetical protein